jgi:mono/diheme cytochrome c family protein
MIRPYVFALTGLLIIAPTLSAADSPRDEWIKAKCALCHGTDGSSQTDTGRKVHAPDLRTPEVQKLSDETLATNIARGHKGMPSFRAQVDAARMRILISYLRGLAKG